MRVLTPDHVRLLDAAEASDHCRVGPCPFAWCGCLTIFAPEGLRIEVTPNTQPHAAARALGLTLNEEQAADD